MIRSIVRGLAYPYFVRNQPSILSGLHHNKGNNQARCQSNTTMDPTSATQKNYQARVDLAAAYRGLDFYNLQDGVCNHLTLRAPHPNGEGDVMLVINYGTHWRHCTASSIIGVDFKTGEVLHGDGEIQEFALHIHRAVHSARYEDGVTCVMHTHQPYATALACIKDGHLKNIHQSNMMFHNKIAYDAGYGGTPVGQECEKMVKHLGKKEVLFMGNHGIMVVGSRVSEVFDKVYYLERSALIQVLAMSTGRELWECPDHVAEEVASYDWTDYQEAHFEAIKKLIEKQEPDYRS